MKAVRLYGTHDLRVESLPKPECEPGKVLIRTLYCGVCGSDVPRLFGGDVARSPEAIGHEFSAIVEEIGEGVTTLKRGDLVVVAPLIVCHECPDCKSGHFGQCKNSKFIGVAFPDKSGFIEYNVVDEINAMKLPDGIDPLKAAFVEPLSVSLHGLFLMGLRKGEDIAVIGAGTIGLLAVQAARALGAGRIFVFDINPSRLERARLFGAHAVFNTAEDGYFEDYLSQTSGRGVGQIVEAVGEEATIQLAIRAADTAGDIAIIGTMHKDVTLPPSLFYSTFSRRQLNIHGVWMSYSDNYPGDEWREAARLIADGSVNVEALIDRIVDIDDAYEAMCDYTIPNKVSGKIMLKMTPEQ